MTDNRNGDDVRDTASASGTRDTKKLPEAADNPSTHTYVLRRDDLRDWHYDDLPGTTRPGSHPHPGFSDSAAWTHCICFGAAYHAVEPLLDEVYRLREGIRETVEGLDRADAYDTPLYERLTALLYGEVIPVPEVDVCPKCGTEGAQCCI